jgi:hypothetical protein
MVDLSSPWLLMAFVAGKARALRHALAPLRSFLFGKLRVRMTGFVEEVEEPEKQQVSPLRFAPVEMTLP